MLSWNFLHESWPDLESEIADLKAQHAKRDIVEADLRKELETVRQHRGEAQTELRLTKQALAEQTSTHEKALKELKEANAESIREQQKVVHRAQADKEQLLAEQARLTALNAQLTNDLEQAKQSAGQQASNHRTELDKLSEELNRFKEAEIATRQQCEVLESELADARKETTILQELHAKTREDANRENEQFKALQVEKDREHTALSARVESAERKLAGLEQQVIQLTAERDTFKAVVEQFQIGSKREK